jgi:hypothetical protein
MTDWTKQIAGERMAVDQQFTDQVASSSFSNQQWGLIMTAVEFDISNPEDPNAATLVADTSKLPGIMPELEQVGRQAPGGGQSPERKQGGILSSLKSTLGLGGDEPGGSDQLDEASEMASEYADLLQAELEANGRWESICGAVREQGGPPDTE